jgi:RimJ/RimL family protein N-acetyltransferase
MPILLLQGRLHRFSLVFIISNMCVSFRPLSEEDIPLMHRWFNEPHVQEFYSLRSWTMEEVRQKLAPILSGEKKVKGELIVIDGVPVGYLQSYPVSEHPWPGQDLPEGFVEKAIGLDLFIGEKEHVGKGYGSQAVRQFISKFPYCVVDPDEKNQASICLFERCGFHFHKEIEMKNPLGKRVKLMLMISGA